MQKKTHIKKGDLVKVIAGEDRTKQGRVLAGGPRKHACDRGGPQYE